MYAAVGRHQLGDIHYSAYSSAFSILWLSHRFLILLVCVCFVLLISVRLHPSCRPGLSGLSLLKGGMNRSPRLTAMFQNVTECREFE